MRYILYLMIFFWIGCTHEMLDDPSTYSDSQAGYESMWAEIDGKSGGVYVVPVSQIGSKFLSFMGKFTGTYEIRSKDCAYEKTGVYSNGSTINLSLSELMGHPTVDKTCAVFLDAYPAKPPKAEHAVYPISRTITVVASTKLGNLFHSLQIEKHGSFQPFELSAPVSTADKKYMIIKKCSRDEGFEQYGPFSFTGLLTVDPEELHFDNTMTGYCYFSILYQSDEGTYRYGFAINVYREDFRPLMVLHGVQKKKYRIEESQYVYSCGIHDEHAIDDKCDRKLKHLPTEFLIYAHTNKRSFFEVTKK